MHSTSPCSLSPTVLPYLLLQSLTSCNSSPILLPLPVYCTLSFSVSPITPHLLSFVQLHLYSSPDHSSVWSSPFFPPFSYPTHFIRFLPPPPPNHLLFIILCLTLPAACSRPSPLPLSFTFLPSPFPSYTHLIRHFMLSRIRISSKLITTYMATTE